MNGHFASFIRTQLDNSEQKEAAARMGISPAQLCKVLKGQHCEHATVTKIVAGISEDEQIQAECLAAFLRDFLGLGGRAARRIRISVHVNQSA